MLLQLRSTTLRKGQHAFGESGVGSLRGRVRAELLPWARAAKLTARHRAAQLRASSGALTRAASARPPVFILGCGRSGTTLLGELLGGHPDVRYLFEPYHLWTAVEPRTDMLHLFHRGAASCVLDGEDAAERAIGRFNALFRSAGAGAAQVVEKTPINTLRIGFLEALAPGAKYIHIVRDGVDVAHSIDRLATTNAYRIAARPNFNQWWGVDGVKWRLLRRDGASLGHHPLDVWRINSHAGRGAYEWLCSLHEVDRRRSALSGRLLEIRYPDLVTDPSSTLETICSFMNIPAPESWRSAACGAIRPARRRDNQPIELPPAMLGDFEQMRDRYGFKIRSGRADRRKVVRIAS